MESVTPGLVAEVACGARDWDAFERETTSLLLQAIGGDTAFFADPSGISRNALGVITEVREQTQPYWPQLSSESSALLAACVGAQGTLIDSQVFGRDLARMKYYDLLMRPVRGRTTLIGVITRAGKFSHKIAIGRCQGSSPFDARDEALLGALLPTITLASAALLPHGNLPAGLAPLERRRQLLRTLTPREREVLDYVRLGYSNEQIGTALGTRARTVRNQLSRVYEKLGVANRAEAVGVSLDPDA